MSVSQSSIWESIIQRKKEEQASKIPNDWILPPHLKPSTNLNNYVDIPQRCGLLSKKELDITENYDATALAKEIREKRLKSVDVVRAFCKRAAIAQQLTNCLTEIFFDEALKRAAFLDAHLASGKPPLGPLHGVPISLKDSFRVKGHDASIGYATLCFEHSRTNSTLVDLLLNVGAVLYCKTNVPQTLMALDSHNNVFGRTLNPHNLLVTAGGSTGGEGALIAMRGSVLGVGTDVGGSIRIPAMCNGVYGVKPSWQRIPYAGQENGALPGLHKLGLPASAGPLATSMRDCELFFNAIYEQKPWEVDPDIIPWKWELQATQQPEQEDLSDEEEVAKDKLGDQPKEKSRKESKNIPQSLLAESYRPVIGLVRRDGLIEPLPIIAKLLDEVARSLRSQGIEVVELDITPLFSQCQSLANALFGIDGGNYTLDLIEATEEPLSPWLSMRLKRKAPRTLDEVRALHARKNGLEKEFLKIWKTTDGRRVDALICPVAPHPVPPIDRWNGVSYTSTWVLLDYPAGTVPIRTVKPNDLYGNVPSTKPLSSWDKVNRELWTSTDRSVYLGTPLCIQVVAPKLEEQRLMRVMGLIDRANRSHWNSSSQKPRL